MFGGEVGGEGWVTEGYSVIKGGCKKNGEGISFTGPVDWMLGCQKLSGSSPVFSLELSIMSPELPPCLPVFYRNPSDRSSRSREVGEMSFLNQLWDSTFARA